MSRSHHHGTPKTRHAGGLNLVQIGGQPMLGMATCGYVSGCCDRNRARLLPPAGCCCAALSGSVQAFEGA